MAWWSRTADLDAALQICARDPVASVLVSTRLVGGAVPARLAAGDVWLYPPARPRALCLASPNMVPLVAAGDVEALEHFAARALGTARRCSSIVGNAADALSLWARLRPQWGPPRDVRAHQHSMVITSDPLIAPDERVRPARLAELDLVVPACVEMFTEEVGYSPVAAGGASYVARVRALVDNGLSFVRLGPGGVEFKAEVGALGLGVAQIQGVWVRPDLRGRGLASAGMAAVVKLVRERIAATVSLYVNDYNLPAVRSYQRVGFTTVGEFATIHF